MKNGLLPLVDDNSVILILGTMPGEKSIALQQYYGNRGNHFWKILFSVFRQPFDTEYAVRKKLLATHRIALWNVLAACERPGSADHKITNEVVNDFASFHAQYPGIKYVFFESKSAQQFYAKYVCAQPGIIYDTLPSTSGLNAGISFEQKLQAWMKLGHTIS
jgi:hypoxanthine-DNA glycosylase